MIGRRMGQPLETTVSTNQCGSHWDIQFCGTMQFIPIWYNSAAVTIEEKLELQYKADWNMIV